MITGDGLITSKVVHGGSGMNQVKSYGEINCAHAQLGDQRRTKRLVQPVDQMCARPGGTLPQKFRNPADLQAFYRLMRQDKVTHKAIMSAHCQATLKQIEQADSPVLILHDATELDYTTHKSLDKLGPIGNGGGRGYITQNSLAVNSMTREVLGLTNQILHRREKVPAGETNSQRSKRKSRESLLWLKGTETLPSNWNLVDVCDRGADTFEFIDHEIASGRRFVIRSYHNRRIFTGHGSSESCELADLKPYARSLPSQGEWNLQVSSKVERRRGRGKIKSKVITRHGREAKMAISFAPVQIRPSKGNKRPPLVVWIVRVWEINPPEGQERLEWILITNDPITSFMDAYRVVGWYECRWIIEEYHKGMKTGCQIESPQFTAEQRLQPAIAILSIVTIKLFQLRDASRRPDATTRAATTLISPTYVKVLSVWRHKSPKLDWTVQEFYMALARLGGHQNRKGDHPPGWQVIWEGWKELVPMVIGYEVAKSKT
jgi:hypothetical protein